MEEAVVKQGWIYQQLQQPFGKRWKKLWAVLYRDSRGSPARLELRDGPERPRKAEPARRPLQLRDCIRVVPAGTETSCPGDTVPILLDTAERRVLLAAPTAEADEWIRRLCELAFPRSQEEPGVAKEGSLSSPGTEGEFSMEENSLYSSRDKGGSGAGAAAGWGNLPPKASSCSSCSSSSSSCCGLWGCLGCAISSGWSCPALIGRSLLAWLEGSSIALLGGGTRGQCPPCPSQPLAWGSLPAPVCRGTVSIPAPVCPGTPTEGEEFYEASPYEPVTSRLSDIFRLASIFSGMDPATTSKSNHCLDAAKACNLNDNCKRLRSGYISTCSRELSATEPCSRRKCHKALRQFFDRVPGEFTFRLLFCSCKDPACAERRRQTIVPSCSYEDKDKPNCLDLRGACRMDHLCRSRLADFHTNCQATFQSLTSCPGDNFQACLGSYAGLIGFDITPNYVDASTTSITISPWCSCKGSGNMEEECEKFLRDFTENPCLRNAIQAFGNGTDVNVAPKNPNPVTVLPKADKSPVLPDDVNDSNTAYDTSVISTCTSLQEQGLKPNKSKEQSLCYSEAQLTTDVMPDQKTFMDPKGGSSRHRESRILFLIPILIPALGL
ncbi:GDNF family receptor alpha-2 [Parus major]|uniref:GDNF family receptor alpha-2 n=1 Tax=Parus major TaxID=9157 RepID=UPI00144416EB|nr:GDNF family receptor alpha-2 [Parus major]